MIKEVVITKLDIIDTLGGSVMHAMKASSAGYTGFGEAYFSQVDQGAIKAWKRHNKMTLNLAVPLGEIRFVLFDDREVSNTQFQEIIISKGNYCRLTVAPGIWMAFQGQGSELNLLLNIASIEHNPEESKIVNLDSISYNWSKS